MGLYNPTSPMGLFNPILVALKVLTSWTILPWYKSPDISSSLLSLIYPSGGWQLPIWELLPNLRASTTWTVIRHGSFNWSFQIWKLRQLSSAMPQLLASGNSGGGFPAVMDCQRCFKKSSYSLYLIQNLHTKHGMILPKAHISLYQTWVGII